MTRTIDDQYLDRTRLDLSQEYSELLQLREKVRIAETQFNDVRVDDVVRFLLKTHNTAAGNEREKLTNYLGLLVSSGKSDKELLDFGTAYLREFREPDSRYSGC